MEWPPPTLTSQAPVRGPWSQFAAGLPIELTHQPLCRCTRHAELGGTAKTDSLSLPVKSLRAWLGGIGIVKQTPMAY